MAEPARQPDQRIADLLNAVDRLAAREQRLERERLRLEAELISLRAALQAITEDTSGIYAEPKRMAREALAAAGDQQDSTE